MKHFEVQEIKMLESVFDIEGMDKSDILIFEENDGKLRGEGRILIFLENGTYHIYVDKRNKKSKNCYFDKLSDAMNYYFWRIQFSEIKLKSHVTLYINEHKDSDVPMDTSIEEDLEILQSELERHLVPASRYQIITDEVTPASADGWIMRILDDNRIKTYVHDKGRLSHMCLFDQSFDATDFFFWTLTGAETHRDIYARHHREEPRTCDAT